MPSISRTFPAALATLSALLVASSASAWDPQNGDWSKSDPNHVRVLTWNVQDAICSSSNRKTEAFTDWHAIVRTIGALRPDVVLLQETGDNNGNGTGSGVDSVSTLETTLDLLINGGADPFVGGTVGAYIKKYVPDLDYPYVFVSSVTDGFNRNVILSRFPFADLNQDLNFEATRPSIVVLPDLYAPGFNGGIRGFMTAEIDLPDDVYAGDLVVGNCHLKSGGSSGDVTDRRTAAKNIAYFIDYMYNGGGSGTPDPRGSLTYDVQGQTTILDPNTPVVWGGDFNQNPGGAGETQGPAEWMTRAQLIGGTDGTDRDRSDSSFDTAAHPLTGSQSTRGGSKLDYIAWQDSIATAVREVVFTTHVNWPSGVPYPSPVDGFFGGGATTGIASDHYPVFVDFALPEQTVPACEGDADGNGSVDVNDLTTVVNALGNGSAGQPGVEGDVDGNGVVNVNDITYVVDRLGQCL